MPDDDEETTAPAAVQPAPAELANREKVDFTKTIERLEQRASDARRRAKLAGMLLMLGATGVVSVLIYSLLLSEPKSVGISSFGNKLFQNRGSVEAPLVRRVQYIVLKLIGPSEDPFPNLGKLGSAASAPPKPAFTPPDKEEASQLKADLKEALLDLEKAVQIADIGKKTESAASPIGPIVSTAVFSLGAVGVLVLLIQISVMFIRYHLRLGELYDAQADALRASAGSPSLAYALLQHLSPNAIEVGRSPTSLYEKAFDAIQAVAKR